MTKRSKIKNDSVNFQIFGLWIVNYMPPTLIDYIKAYSNKLSELERLFYSNNEIPKNKKFNIIWLKKFYIEAVLVCKIFIEESKKYKDINNQKILEDWLQKIINQLKIIDLNNTENLKDALDSYNLN